MEGSIVSSIVKIAEKEKVDMIAMTTHGRSCFGQLYYGSITGQILQRVPCPLFLIRCMN